MDKTILFPHEIALLALRKAEDVYRDFVSNAKRFAQEVISGGGVTALGFHSKHVRKQSSPILAFFNRPSTILTFALINDMEQAQQIELAHREELKKILTATNTPALPKEEQSGLTNNFTETVGVSEEVYTALYNQVADFENALDFIEEQTEQALDENFTGPLTREFESVRNGACAFPLTCEFEAHAALKETGIEYIKEDNTYIFPEKMVTAFRREFGDTTKEQDANHFVVVRNTAQQPEGRRNFLSQNNMAQNFIDSIQQKGGSYAPAPAYIYA